MKLPRVYPILDAESLARRGVALETAAAAFLEGGAGILQIRQKGHWGREFFAAARQVARLCREAGALLIVNDRADFALLLDAGPGVGSGVVGLGVGLHLGQDDLTPRDARGLMGPDAVIGFSSHNAAQLAAGGGEPVDYVALGPVFVTDSKRNPDPVLGVEEIRRCRLLVEKPLVAIGGITLRNAGEVWKAGADSVAVIGGLLPERATAQSLRQRMEEWQRLQKAAGA
ncbi:MAG TPA: thiamine phosphate synthase [Candidatus Acidoferrales bacterium]|jgi:thiamine-phosphate pyrophosphorylase|nr:thiamine phosphate synthase [Candidatus Acidoferrales bacterium]